MSDPVVRVPIGDWIESVVDWLTATFDGFFDLVKDILLGGYDALDMVLTAPPFWGIIAALSALAWWVAGGSSGSAPARACS